MHSGSNGYTILPQVSFNVLEYNNNKQNIIIKIIEDFSSKYTHLIVRSSAISEDNANESKAGKYLSIGNVSIYPQDGHQISQVIEQVIQSFDENEEDNQIFVQPMLRNIELSGVIFTVDPNNEITDIRV